MFSAALNSSHALNTPQRRRNVMEALILFACIAVGGPIGCFAVNALRGVL
jgi:hypothetical protein